MPPGEPLRAAVRSIKPSSIRPETPPPVPPNPTRHDLRTYPIPEEIHPVDSEDPLDFTNGFSITPLPFGCMINLGPRRKSTY